MMNGHKSAMNNKKTLNKEGIKTISNILNLIKLTDIEETINWKENEFFISNQWKIILRESILSLNDERYFSCLASSRMALESLLIQLLYNRGIFLKEIKDKKGKGPNKYFELGVLIEYSCDRLFNKNEVEYYYCQAIKNRGNLYVHPKPPEIVSFHEKDSNIQKDKVIEENVRNESEKKAIYGGLLFKFKLQEDAINNLKDFAKLLELLNQKNMIENKQIAIFRP